jgi:Fe-Mn family superoxide dismutase
MQFAAAGTAMAAWSALGTAAAQTAPPTSAKLIYTPKPLPLDPKSIKGLSEKILTSHYDNNYTGAVKRLNAIAAQLAELDLRRRRFLSSTG